METKIIYGQVLAVRHREKKGVKDGKGNGVFGQGGALFRRVRRPDWTGRLYPLGGGLVNPGEKGGFCTLIRGRHGYFCDDGVGEFRFLF